MIHEFIAVVHFTDTITLGSIIIGVLVGVGGLATYGYGVRWKANYEVEKARADALEQGREAFRVQADRLHRELEMCKADRDKLEMTRSLEPALKLMKDGFEELARDLQTHLNVLSRIADALADLGVKNGDH